MYPVCSFCGDRPVVAWIEGPDFQNAVDSADKVRAEEAWLACSVCLAVVEAKDRERLARRAIRLARRSRVLPDKKQVQDMRTRLEESFWAARFP